MLNIVYYYLLTAAAAGGNKAAAVGSKQQNLNTQINHGSHVRYTNEEGVIICYFKRTGFILTLVVAYL